MATQNIIVTNTAWVNLVSTLELVNKTKYVLQNVGHNEVKVIESSVSPDEHAVSHLVSPGQTICIIPLEGTNIYAKTISGYKLITQLVATEA